MRARGEGWSWPTRALHWSMAALILFQFGLGLQAAEFTPDVAERFRLVQTHKSWGVVILVLALTRILWRVLGPPPPSMPAAMRRWQARAARISHVLLYGLMLALPLTGWVMAAASPVQDLLGMQNMAFGVLVLPDPWVPGDAAVEAAARVAHQGCVALLVVVLTVHTGAALKHQFIDRDGILSRMAFGS